MVPPLDGAAALETPAFTASPVIARTTAPVSAAFRLCNLAPFEAEARSLGQLGRIPLCRPMTPTVRPWLGDVRGSGPNEGDSAWITCKEDLFGSLRPCWPPGHRSRRAAGRPGSSAS